MNSHITPSGVENCVTTAHARVSSAESVVFLSLESPLLPEDLPSQRIFHCTTGGNSDTISISVL